MLRISLFKRPLLSRLSSLIQGGGRPARAEGDLGGRSSYAASAPPRMSFVDMHTYTLGLVNTSTNAHANVDLKTLPGWPGPAPLHTLLMPSGDKVYVSYMGSKTEPVGLAVIEIRSINWDTGTADVVVTKDLQIDPAGAPSSFPRVTQTDPGQPIATWNHSDFGQVHAPQFLPHSSFAYFSMWTDNRVLVVDTATDTMAPAQTFGALSQQLHGVHFNPAGNLGLSAGYYYDKGVVSLFRPDRRKGELTYVADIWLGTPTRYAAYTHTVVWLDNRYAVTGTMQFGPTSLTPPGSSIIPPGIWLIDARRRTAKQIIGQAKTVDDPGVLRSASYVAMARRKLFVAEEDSLDESFGDDGFVSVFDMTPPDRPRFIKRFRPGVELPADFNVAHAFSVTPDDRFVFVESYSSGYIIKIDVASLEVVHVDHHAAHVGVDHDGGDHDHGDHGGLVMPHGMWIAAGH
jgi:hypothetical protein